MDINKILNSDYLDIIYDGRNKKYGGYELRRKYRRRMTTGVAIIAGLVLIFAVSNIIAGMNTTKTQKIVVTNTPVKLMEPPPPIDPKKLPPPPPPSAPPPPVPPPTRRDHPSS